MSFLDDVFSPISDAFSTVAKPFLGAIGSAAPALGNLIGGRFGGPAGAAIGGSLGSAAQNFLGGGQQQQAPQQQQPQYASPISPETYSLAPTPSPNIAPYPYASSAGIQNESANPFSTMQPGNMGGWAGRTAGNAAGNSVRNFMGPEYSQRYGNTNFGGWGGQAGEDFGSAMSNMLPSQFQGMAAPFLKNAGRNAGNWMTDRFMPQQWQNRNLDSFGDMGEQYGSQYNGRINNTMSPEMQGGVKDSFFPQMAAARNTGGAPGTPPPSPYATQNQNSPDQGDLSGFEGFQGMPEGFKYGGHVTRGNTDFASAIRDLGYAY